MYFSCTDYFGVCKQNMLVQWKLNGKEMVTPDTMSILQAAQQQGITIPTLCYREHLPLHTSCMICAVEDKHTGRMLPACSAKVQSGLDIWTNTPTIQSHKKTVLQLLLEEHLGDCYAPCQKLCGAEMDIPLMLRHIQKREWEAACIVVKDTIPIPSILGRICSAPCEKGCRRAKHDGAVNICRLKQFIGDWDLEQPHPYKPKCDSYNGHNIAIVGAGPLGLSAAYYLQKMGYACTIYDEHSLPGGMLRYGIFDGRLNEQILQKEIGTILQLGIIFQGETYLTGDITNTLGLQQVEHTVSSQNTLQYMTWENLAKEYSAIVIAIGRQIVIKELDIVSGQENLLPYQLTANSKFFIGSRAGQNNHMAVRSVGDGKKISQSIHAWLGKIKHTSSSFFCRIGQLTPSEFEHIAGCNNTTQQAIFSPQNSISEDIAVLQAGRCWHCDCHKTTTCKLKQLAEENQILPIVYKNPRSSKMEITYDSHVYLEANKCIRCGICVRICQKNKEPVGLNFSRRGSAMKIEIPEGFTLREALGNSLQECIDACPVGALYV